MNKHWLMKTEPSVFSFSDLKFRPGKTDHWEGVRNYQARNYMRDEMRKGDFVLFYHSNCKEPGVVGIARVSRKAYPDYTAWDKHSRYYDPKSSPEKPRWYMVDVTYIRDFRRTVTIREMRTKPELRAMKLLIKGQRLSVMPVTAGEFRVITAMGAER